MELHQKALWEQRNFFLLPNKLKIQLNSLAEAREHYISYEYLTGEAQIYYRKNFKLFYIAIATFAFAGCVFLQSLLLNQGFYYALFPLIVAIALACLYQYRQQNYIILETQDHSRVVFFRNKPNRQAVEQFLIQLWSYRKQYLKEKYFYIDRHHNLEQQTKRLRWLLEQNVITKAEFKLAQEDWIIVQSERSRLV